MPTKETWLFINTFADWFAAFGTIGAVIVSLWLAMRDRVRLKVSANMSFIVGAGAPRPPPEYLSIRVVNVGPRTAKLTGIGWRVGFFKRRLATQIPDDSVYSAKIPALLEPSEEAVFMIDVHNYSGDWFVDFARKLLTPHPRLSVWTLYVQAHTSVGATSSARPGVGVRNRLLDAAKRAATTP